MDDGYLEISKMKYADSFIANNKFRWIGNSEEDEENVRTCKKEDILLQIKDPMPAEGSSRRLQYYKLREEDFCDASDVLQLVLGCK